MYFRATEVILKISTCSLTRRPDFDQILIMKNEYAVCVSFTINTPTGISANSLSFMDRDNIYLDKISMLGVKCFAEDTALGRPSEFKL